MTHDELLLGVLETNKLILHRIEKLEKLIMATRSDLNTAITALPAAIVAAVGPIETLDFTPEITAINAVPAQVATLLQTPTPAPTPAPAA
jgi:hypothetical protein